MIFVKLVEPSFRVLLHAYDRKALQYINICFKISCLLLFNFIKGVIQEVGSIGLSIAIWIICGIISIFGALTYTELGCMIPKAGGEYEYLMTAFGNLLGFLFVWAQLVIIIPTANAVAALTFSDYLLQPFFPDCDIPNLARICVAASAVCK